jgi:hypothetical protein
MSLGWSMPVEEKGMPRYLNEVQVGMLVLYKVKVVSGGQLSTSHLRGFHLYPKITEWVSASRSSCWTSEGCPRLRHHPRLIYKIGRGGLFIGF